MVVVLALTGLCALVIVAITLVVVVHTVADELEAHRTQTGASRRMEFQAAMEALAMVQERVVAGNNASLERIVELIHGPAIVETPGDEPEFDIRVENLPPWYENVEDVDGRDPTDDLDPDPIVVDQTREATMVRPRESMVP